MVCYGSLEFLVLRNRNSEHRNEKIPKPEHPCTKVAWHGRLVAAGRFGVSSHGRFWPRRSVRVSSPAPWLGHRSGAAWEGRWIPSGTTPWREKLEIRMADRYR